MLRKRCFSQIVGLPSPSALSQRERGLNPFSLWEKVRMRGSNCLLLIYCVISDLKQKITTYAVIFAEKLECKT
jgi:hypothetical protein